ncbi:MAG TPA: MFS transporter [Bryobacteraceae bacterium]|nr:MFS transporter [Bryobacteraceae bacterium]
MWRNSDFLKLWTGQTVSELGSRITRDGLPLAAVLVLNAGPMEMSILKALNGAAVLLLGLYAGMWSDRFRRRPTMIVADVGRAMLLAIIPAAAVLHRLNMPLLYVVATLTGILTIFFDVAYQTYLPDLVERANVLEGNSKLALSHSIAEIVGPGLTGVLVQILTAPMAILFDALSFLFSAVTVSWIRKPERIHPRTSEEHPFHEAIGGFRFIASNPALRLLAAYNTTAFFCFGIFQPLYVLYAIRELGLSALQLQIAIMSGGVAALLGAALAPRIGRLLGLGPTFLISAALLSCGTLLIPLARGPALVALGIMIASQFVGDVAMMTFNVHEVSLRQTLAPEAVLGRVNGSMRLLTFGVLPIGTLAGGGLASWIGLRPALWIAVAGLGLAVAWLVPLRVPDDRPRDTELRLEAHPD